MSKELEAILALAATHEAITVRLSPESLAVLFYGWESVKNPDYWLTEEPYDEVTDDDRDAIDRIISNALEELLTENVVMDYPSVFLSLPPEWKGRDGYNAGWAAAGEITSPFNVAGAAAPLEVGSGLVMEVMLDAGTYYFRVDGVYLTTGAILAWSIDGSDFIVSQDWYAESNYVSYQEGAFAVGTAGRHIISCRVIGQNEASEGYGYGLCCISGYKVS